MYTISADFNMEFDVLFLLSLQEKMRADMIICLYEICLSDYHTKKSPILSLPVCLSRSINFAFVMSHLLVVMRGDTDHRTSCSYLRWSCSVKQGFLSLFFFSFYRCASKMFIVYGQNCISSNLTMKGANLRSFF